jgi:hypothetical protein
VCTQPLSLPLSVSLSLSLSIYLSLTHPLSLSLSLSLTHTHTHTLPPPSPPTVPQPSLRAAIARKRRLSHSLSLSLSSLSHPLLQPQVHKRAGNHELAVLPARVAAVHYLAHGNISNVQFHHQCDLQQISAMFATNVDGSVNQFAGLPGNASFNGSTSHTDILDALDIVLRARDMERIRKAPYFSVTFDEAKDASRFSRMALHFHICNDEGDVDTILAALIRVGSTKGITLLRIVLRWGSANGISWARCVGAAGDGAGGVAGKKRGAIPRLLLLLPWAIGRCTPVLFKFPSALYHPLAFCFTFSILTVARPHCFLLTPNLPSRCIFIA